MPVSTLIVLPAIFLMGVILHIVPAVTRPGVFFGVTVDPEFRRTEEGRRILLRYRSVIWIGMLGACALGVLGIYFALVPFLAASFIFAFVGARRQVRPHAATPGSVREVDLALPDERLPGGPIVALGPLALLGGLGLWAYMHWDRLPERFPVHWGLRGQDRWVPRAPETVFGLLLVLASVCLMLLTMAWGLLHWTRRVSTTGPAAESERRFRKSLLRLLIACEYFVAVPGWCALFQPAGRMVTIWFVALTVLVIVMVVTLMRAGQGSSRLSTAAAAPLAGDRTPDACWKWGLVYVNPDDPAILIEKRFGVGYTLNLGNRWTWVALSLTLVPILLGAFLLR